MPADTLITIDLPLLNPEAIGSMKKSYFVNRNNVRCTDVDSGRKLNCKVDKIVKSVGTRRQVFDHLTITDALPEGLVKDGHLNIEIDSMINPLSLTTRKFWTTFSVPGYKNPKRKYSIE